MENELWKPIHGFDELYEISSFGRVKSVEHFIVRGNSNHARVPSKIIKPWINAKGYLCVALHKDGASYKKKVHRLVAEAFIENPDCKPHIDHIDTNKSNNAVSNLRWVTPSENKNNPITVELHRKTQLKKEVVEKCMRGRELVNGKTRRIPVNQFDKEGNFMARYESMNEAARVTGIGSNFISPACAGKIKYAGGYLWEYAK